MTEKQSHFEMESMMTEKCSGCADAVWGGRPTSVDPVVYAYCRWLSRFLEEKEEQRIKPHRLIPLGTAGSEDLSVQRAFRCADFAIREVAPEILLSERKKNGGQEGTLGLNRAIGGAARRLRQLLPIINESRGCRAQSEAHEGYSRIPGYHLSKDVAYGTEEIGRLSRVMHCRGHSPSELGRAAGQMLDLAAKTTPRKIVIDKAIRFLIEICAMKEKRKRARA